MKIHIVNTESKTKEVFKPLKEGEVSMYHCGPTVYWTQHIGNLRAVVMADIVVRTFVYLGYSMSLVRNYTDVGHLTSDEDDGEDKMEKGAKREGKTPLEIAQTYVDIYEKDISQLNVSPATQKPRATEHIADIIEMIKLLLEKGYAYLTPQAVYFDTSKAEDYYRLTGQKRDENRDGAGSGSVQDSNKKHPSDFAVWFFRTGKHENALQYWTSPFQSQMVEQGEGFPGWHIECSAMSKKYLGSTLDIHMGGIEHIPVHHTNEIAQSEAANGVPFVNYWIHNEHLTVDGAKMAKSEGTSYVLDDVIKKGYDPLALRFFFLQAHYRSKQNFTWEALEAAKNGLESLYEKCAAHGDQEGEIDTGYEEKFREAIADDFNMPRALAVMFEMMKSDIKDANKLATATRFDSVLGLDIKTTCETHRTSVEIPEEVKKLVALRDEARAKKDFDTSDKLRDEIIEIGFEVFDKESGTEVRKAR